MKEFFSFAEGEDFRRLLDEATQNTNVQGVTIDFDPLWMHLAKLRQSVPKGPFEDLMRYVLSDLKRGWSWTPRLWQNLCHTPGMEADLLSERLDSAWLPPWWNEYNKLFGRPTWESPIIVRICLLPNTQTQELPSLGSYPFPIFFERRPQAQFCYLKTPQVPLVGGLSIGVGPNESGTLGGIVKDQSGIHYGVTCAHVVEGGTIVDQPAQQDNRAGSIQIGTVGSAVSLQVSQATTPCNPNNSGSVMNEIDVALIQFDASTAADMKVASLGSLSRILPAMDIQPGSAIYFTGKESGVPARKLIIGGLNVTFRFKNQSNNYFCFKNTFQVRWSNSSASLGTPAVQAGDSGAWLCTPDANGYAWAGMVMGSDQFVGHAVFAEGVSTWASNLTPSLTLEVL